MTGDGKYIVFHPGSGGISHFYQLTWARLNVTEVHVKRDLLLGSRLVGNILSVARILSKDS